MKKLWLLKVKVFVVCVLMLSMPALIHAQTVQTQQGPPPVVQPLADEGTFAIRLGAALGVVTTDDEVEAESVLGNIWIAPRNGWIADYPVTPDIVVELQNAVTNVADSGKLTMGRRDALKRLQDVAEEFGLWVKPYTAGTTYEPTPSSCRLYPNPMDVNNTYINEGPPVVTYYCPPPDYYYLYTWVPCPFWWSDLWFPGFFVLHDFHKIVRVHRKVVVISNHFNDRHTHRAFRIDPLERFRGRTFAGIGVSHPQNFISTGIPRSDRTIFNGTRPYTMHGGRMAAPPSSHEGATGRPSGHGGSPPSHGGGGFSGSRGR